MLRKEGDNLTIGISLCLELVNKDIPEYVQSQLPKVEEIELYI